MEITLTSYLAKIVLRLNPLNRLVVMCLGYGEDFEQFTELVWEDDKDLDIMTEKFTRNFNYDIKLISLLKLYYKKLNTS